MRITAAALVVAGFLMAGCAGMPRISPELRAALDRIANEPTPTCDLKTCPDKWALAQVWITHHSSMKIQLVSDAIIHTYGTTDDHYSFSAAKVPTGNGEYRIEVAPSCGNWNCLLSPDEMAHSFDHYLNTNEDVLLLPTTAPARPRKCPAGSVWKFNECYPEKPAFGSSK